jgi:hypothetical protein
VVAADLSDIEEFVANHQYPEPIDCPDITAAEITIATNRFAVLRKTAEGSKQTREILFMIRFYSAICRPCREIFTVMQLALASRSGRVKYKDNLFQKS